MEPVTFLEALGIGTVTGLAVAIGVLWFGRTYFTGYLDAKGRNLATKEDVSKLTELVEEVKHRFSIDIEERRAKNQLRMAALDKRLQVHQEAFALWRKLHSNLGEGGMGAIVEECSDWWNKNCLYLEPEAREAFSSAYFHAHLHGAHERMNLHQRVQDDIDIVIKAGDIILKAVQLPGLTQQEKAEVAKVDSGAKGA